MAGSLNVTPLQGKIIIDIDKAPTEKKSAGGIIMAEINPAPINTATVLAVPHGRYENGILLPCEVKVGDRVVFQPMTQVSVKIGEVEYFAISEGNIICILNDTKGVSDGK